MDMAEDELEKLIKEKETLMEEAEEAFKTGVTELQETYQKLMSSKEETLESIKNSGLGLMKACKAAKVKGGSDEL
jgi:hypothetical protein